MTQENSWEILDAYRGKYFHGEWPTIPEQFHLSASLHPQQLAFTQLSPEKVRITYKQAQSIVANVATWLVAKGLKKGDRVVLIGKNSPWWALGYLACLEAGGVIVPLDVQMEDATINRLIKLVEARFLIADSDKMDVIGRRKTTIKHRVSLTRGMENFIEDCMSTRKHTFSTTTEHDLAAILFTSGTTGMEKGVMLTHANFMSDVYLACHPDFLKAKQTDVWYALLPLHHSYCMTAVFLEGIKHASEIVFAQGVVVEKIMQDLKECKVTIFIGIPLLYNKILKGMLRKVREKGVISYFIVSVLMGISGLVRKISGVNIGKRLFGNLLLKKANLYNLRYLISGGGPLSTETVKRYQQLGLSFIQGYGMTETAPISTLNPAQAFKMKSVGKVLPRLQMITRDVDENGIGEVCVKGPICCQGYWQNAEATADLFDAEGWLRTGDLGYLDADNYLYLTGRSKNLIVTEGGKNIFPEELEDHFQLFQQIEQMMVRGYVADAINRSEGIEALIYPNLEHYERLGIKEYDAIAKNLLHTVRSVNKDLLPYKRINRICIVDTALPMTSTRKVIRPETNEMFPISENGAIPV